MLSVEDDGIETNASKTIGASNDDDDENTSRVINHEELVTQMTTTKVTNLKMTKIRTVTTRKKVRKIILRSILMKKRRHFEHRRSASQRYSLFFKEAKGKKRKELERKESRQMLKSSNDRFTSGLNNMSEEMILKYQ